MSNWFESGVALVTGGSRGIGLAVARRYLDEGAAGVVIVDRAPGDVEVLASAHPGRVRYVQGDVREFEVHERAVHEALSTWGKLDVAVGNAGVFDFRRPLHGYTPELLQSTMDELFAINLRGYLYTAVAAREALLKTEGSIIFTASVASFHSGGGGVLYTMAKHAVVGLVRQLALEWAPHIRVNAVGPGGTVTALSGTSALGHAARTIDDTGDLAERIARHVPLGFAQVPEDHTGLYLLLASKANSRAVTGQVFMSDGGVGVRAV